MTQEIHPCPICGTEVLGSKSCIYCGFPIDHWGYDTHTFCRQAPIDGLERWVQVDDLDILNMDLGDLLTGSFQEVAEHLRRCNPSPLGTSRVFGFGEDKEISVIKDRCFIVTHVDFIVTHVEEFLNHCSPKEADDAWANTIGTIMRQIHHFDGHRFELYQICLLHRLPCRLLHKPWVFVIDPTSELQLSWGVHKCEETWDRIEQHIRKNGLGKEGFLHGTASNSTFERMNWERKAFYYGAASNSTFERMNWERNAFYYGK